jgi:hypothetical protein
MFYGGQSIIEPTEHENRVRQGRNLVRAYSSAIGGFCGFHEFKNRKQLGQYKGESNNVGNEDVPPIIKAARARPKENLNLAFS